MKMPKARGRQHRSLEAEDNRREQQGFLKDTFCPFETWLFHVFSTKIKGSHHLQGNVQVYNVSIPEQAGKLENFAAIY